MATRTRTATLSVTDNRTGKSYELPIEDGAIHAPDLRKIKVDEADFGLMSYDPAFLNTASTRSSITFIDGDLGILRHRGYPIEQLAEQSTYLEVAYLLIHGELPTTAELEAWTHEITYHTFLHENVKRLMEGFRYDAHPMGMLVSVTAALSTFYPEAVEVEDPEVRMKQVHRLIAKVPTIAAFSYRHGLGLPYVYPQNELGFTANFLSMMYRTPRATAPTRLSSGRSRSCSSSTPTTSRTARLTRCARSARARWIRTRRSPAPLRRSGARSTAVPTSRCCGC